MIDTIVQDEAARVNAWNTRMCDFERNVAVDIMEWKTTQPKTYISFRTVVEDYWRQVHGIEV